MTQLPVDGALLREIAEGIGTITPPLSPGDDPRHIRRELVLSTEVYDVWVMWWPSGAVSDMHQHPVPIAYYVVDGLLRDTRFEGDGCIDVEVPRGGSAVLPPFQMHHITAVSAATTVHVHAQHEAKPESEWAACETRT